jgi:ElaB/YqjD/DUF883 family membrane-anchored ribosome-binding protein
MNSDLTRKLVSDYKVMVAEAEGLIKATTSQSAEKIAEARKQMQQALLELKPRLANIDAVLRDNTRLAVSATDEYVRHNPWMAMGAAASVGIAVGLLIGRR